MPDMVIRAFVRTLGLPLGFLLAFSVLAPAHAQTEITRMRNQATKLYEAGDYKGSLALGLQVLKATEAKYGTDNAFYAAMTCNVGLLYKLLGRLDEAAAAAQKCLALYRKIVPTDEDGIEGAMILEAAVAVNQGKYRS